MSFFLRLRHFTSAIVGKAAATLFRLSHDDYAQLAATYVDDAGALASFVIGILISVSSCATLARQIHAKRRRKGRLTSVMLESTGAQALLANFPIRRASIASKTDWTHRPRSMLTGLYRGDREASLACLLRR